MVKKYSVYGKEPVGLTVEISHIVGKYLSPRRKGFEDLGAFFRFEAGR